VAWSCSCSWGALVFAGGLVNSMCKEKSRGRGVVVFPESTSSSLPHCLPTSRPRSPGGPATTSQAHARRSRDKLTAADFKRLRQTLTRARAPSVCQTDGTTD
jgi:hypothetical protein